MTNVLFFYRLGTIFRSWVWWSCVERFYLWMQFLRLLRPYTLFTYISFIPTCYNNVPQSCQKIYMTYREHRNFFYFCQCGPCFWLFLFFQLRQVRTTAPQPEKRGNDKCWRVSKQLHTRCRCLKIWLIKQPHTTICSTNLQLNLSPVKGRSKMTLEGKWLFKNCHFPIKMNIWANIILYYRAAELAFVVTW